ncbi:MAG: hypothetical protein AAF926_07595 [Pseudomonadota bacterium]
MTDQRSRMDRWETTKAKGRPRFVVVNGMLGWGLGLALVTAIGRALLADGAFMDRFPRELMIAVPIWVTVGALWAVLTWRGMEKAEARERAEKDTHNV